VKEVFKERWEMIQFCLKLPEQIKPANVTMPCESLFVPSNNPDELLAFIIVRRIGP